MKKTERICGLIAIIGLIFKLIHFPLGSILFTLSLSVLAILYCYLSFAYFNDIALKEVLKKESYKNITPLTLIGLIGFGSCTSCVVVGILFYLQFWGSSFIYLNTGLFGLLIILITTIIKYVKTKSIFYVRIIKKTVIFGCIGFILTITPPIIIFGVIHRDNPGYVEAVKRAWENPNNKELWDEAERQKHFGHH